MKITDCLCLFCTVENLEKQSKAVGLDVCILYIKIIYTIIYSEVGFAEAINSGIFQSRDFKGWAVNNCTLPWV